MNRKIIVGVGALLLGAGIAVAQQDDFSKVQIRTTKVAGGVTELEGAGGNMSVLSGPDGILLVDDEFAPLAPKIKAALKKIDPKGALKWVVNTHYHGDHTGSNAVFGKDAPILAQTNVRARLEKGGSISFFKATIPPAGKAALPVLTYDQQISLWMNGEEVRVTHYPHGHTDGDSMVWYTGSKVLHTGDDFTNGVFPFVDVENGGDVEHDIANLDDVLSKIDDSWKVIPGHGPLGTKKDVQAFRDMLALSVKTVKDKLAKGEKLEQIQSEGLPDTYKTWGAGHVDVKSWLAIVAESLQRNGAAAK